jgi:hypothetical protein
MGRLPEDIRTLDSALLRTITRQPSTQGRGDAVNSIKPIETVYNGYRFRSRLEARWAVFFDALDVKYEYEPEGFQLSNGSLYLPDFFLPHFDVYVEVKHVNDYFINFPNDNEVSFGKEKYGYFMHDVTTSGHGAWFVFGDPWDALMGKERGGKGENVLFCTCICPAKFFMKQTGDNKNTICCCGGEEVRAIDCQREMLVSAGICAFTDDFIIWDAEKAFFPKTVRAMPYVWMKATAKTARREYGEAGGKLGEVIVQAAERTLDASKRARQARFEHGEMPRI